MKRLAQRRLQNIALLVLGLAAVWLSVRWLDQGLARTSHLTGYAMMAVIFILAGYHARKKLAGLPVGRSSSWLQFHIYVGLGSAVLMLLHTSGRWPTGWLETVLAFAYWGTFTSGVVGLYLSRSIPRQLARTSEEFVYERIPRLRREVVEKSRVAVIEATSVSGATTLADYYCDHIDPYLAEARGGLYALRPSSGLRRQVMRELADLKRYLSDAELVASEKLFALVRKKDDLDFHEASQGLLKRWLFVHIGLTYLLLTTAVMHGWLALTMRGGPG